MSGNRIGSFAGSVVGWLVFPHFKYQFAIDTVNFNLSNELQLAQTSQT
jgi:hypothetical protein